MLKEDRVRLITCKWYQTLISRICFRFLEVKCEEASAFVKSSC
jgi:hypothetical protein